MFVELQRDGHAVDAKEGALDRRGHRPRVEDIDAGVQAAVDAADEPGRAGAGRIQRCQF